VLLLFDNTLMRGNRTTKTSASSFASFNSPNYYPVGTLGLKIEIRWDLVRSCKPDQPTRFHPIKAEVGHLKLTPFGKPVEQRMKYMVIESYGVGNVPTEGPFYEWLLENSRKHPSERITIVNISQVYQSVILNIYATGDMAVKLGLIPGSDMTC
jgi:L-asparaginase